MKKTFNLENCQNVKIAKISNLEEVKISRMSKVANRQKCQNVKIVKIFKCKNGQNIQTVIMLNFKINFAKISTCQISKMFKNVKVFAVKNAKMTNKVQKVLMSKFLKL